MARNTALLPCLVDKNTIKGKGSAIMYIMKELDLNTFEAWSGAVNTLDRIRANDLCEQLEAQLEELYPDGITETELNDLLWFDDDMVYEMLGLKTAEELSNEIDNISTRIDDLIEEKLC